MQSGRYFGVCRQQWFPCHINLVIASFCLCRRFFAQSCIDNPDLKTNFEIKLPPHQQKEWTHPAQFHACSHFRICQCTSLLARSCPIFGVLLCLLLAGLKIVRKYYTYPLVVLKEAHILGLEIVSLRKGPKLSYLTHLLIIPSLLSIFDQLFEIHVLNSKSILNP